MNKVNRMIVALALVGAVGVVSAGCFVPADGYSGPMVRTNYYQPMYYNGYLVYYSDAGVPYYYYNGAVVYVPRTYVGYNRYYSHWRGNRVHYRRWYRHRGHRYRRYNRRKYRRSRRRTRKSRRRTRRSRRRR